MVSSLSIRQAVKCLWQAFFRSCTEVINNLPDQPDKRNEKNPTSFLCPIIVVGISFRTLFALRVTRWHTMPYVHIRSSAQRQSILLLISIHGVWTLPYVCHRWQRQINNLCTTKRQSHKHAHHQLVNWPATGTRCHSDELENTHNIFVFRSSSSLLSLYCLQHTIYFRSIVRGWMPP